MNSILYEIVIVNILYSKAWITKTFYLILNFGLVDFSSFKKNGKEILQVSKAADVFFIIDKGKQMATIADATKSIKMKVSE